MTEILTLHVDAISGSALQPTLELLIFSTTPRAECGAGFIAFYEAFFERYGHELRWYKTNVMKNCRKLPEPGLAQIKQMLTNKKALKSYLLGVAQHSGASAEQYGLPSFEFLSEEDLSDPNEPIMRSFLRVCLPTQEIERADDVLSFVRSSLAEVPFDSGYCGYSYYWNTGDSDVESELEKVNRTWLKRFPGLSYGDPIALISFADKGIIGINWLTLLGNSKFKELGGHQALVKSLQKNGEIKVWPIANERGIVIRAGNQPELGDANRRQTLPLYHTVGHALTQLRVPRDWIENLSVIGMTGEEVVDWYDRFFDSGE